MNLKQKFMDKKQVLHIWFDINSNDDNKKK